MRRFPRHGSGALRSAAAAVVGAIVAGGLLSCGSASNDEGGDSGRSAEVVVSVWFVDTARYATGAAALASVPRRVRAATAIDDAVNALFAGPTHDETDRGLAMVRSGATRASAVGVERGTALVQLLGGCTSGGATLTIADLLVATLRQFDGVRWVKIYGPDGSTQNPATPGDSVPECLEP
jgi:hypothetical protein